MSTHGPRKGEGWNFEDEEDETWQEAFETTEKGYIDPDHYDGFATIPEIVDFVYGEGQYGNTRALTPGREDLEDKKRELHNDEWKIPQKLKDLARHLEEGAELHEIALDPAAEVRWNVVESDARKKDADTKYTAHFVAYDSGDTDVHTHFYTHWYDTPPEQMSTEDILDAALTEEKRK